MVDHDKLVTACDALGMEKPAVAAATAPAATAAAKQSLGALWRSLPGWGRALAIAAPAAAGGAYLAGGGNNKEQIAALLRQLYLMRQRLHGYESSAFAPHEARMFARHGLDPRRLSFLKTLSGFRKGMELENKLLDEALGGQLSQLAPEEEDVGQYA